METNENTLVIKWGKLTIKVDKSEFFPDNPGAGTPIMVYTENSSATYTCATSTGMIEDYILSDKEFDWLWGMESVIYDFLEE